MPYHAMKAMLFGHQRAAPHPAPQPILLLPVRGAQEGGPRGAAVLSGNTRTGTVVGTVGR